MIHLVNKSGVDFVIINRSLSELQLQIHVDVRLITIIAWHSVNCIHLIGQHYILFKAFLQ